MGIRQIDRPRGRAGRLDWAGWSMLELVLSLSLAAAVGAATVGLARAVGLGLAMTESRLEVTQAARRGLERVTEELRWGEAVVGDPACGPTLLCRARVKVRIPPGNPYRRASAYEVTFQHNARQRELERRVDTGVNNLSANVDDVTFQYLSASGTPASTPESTASIHITLRLRHHAGATLTIADAVGLRNHRAPSPPIPTPWPTWRPVPRGPIDRVPVQPMIPPGPLGPPEPR